MSTLIQRFVLAKSLLITFLLSIVTSSLLANDESVLAAIQQEMALSARSATSTNQNIDYQPYILTVLKTEDLMKYGVRTLGEAIVLVPGIDMATNTMNNRTPIFRGSNPTAYGQSLLSIDGFIVNDHLFSGYNAFLDLPIELIERIEVVRGAGSFIEGANGYAGTIHVVTRSHSTDQNGLFASIGTDHAIGGGFYNRIRIHEGSLIVDGFLQRHDQRTPIEVQDVLGRSGYGLLGIDHLGTGFRFQNGNLKLQGRLNRYQSDSAFGNLHVLPDHDGELSQPSWFLQSQYTFPIAPDLNIEFNANIMEESWESDSKPLPDGTCYNVSTGHIIPCDILGNTAGYIEYSQGYTASLMIKNRSIGSSLTLRYTGLQNQIFSFQISSEWDKTIDTKTIGNKVPSLGIQDYTQSKPFIDAYKAKRQTTHLSLTDSINIDETKAMVLTLGYIRASDTDADTYGRAAFVYQPTRNDIYKIIGSSGFRFPSYQEMYVTPSPYAAGNDTLGSEHVVSLETQYLRKLHSDLTYGINLFYISNDNQILRDNFNTFQNYGSSILIGGETEIRGSVTPDDTLALSYSYVEGEGKNIQGNTCTIPYAASHLVKSSYSHTFENGASIGGFWNYVGSKQRSCNDIREALHPYHTLDLAIGKHLAYTNGWYIQAIAKNIYNTTVRYPSLTNTYPEDYPIYDRSFWLRTGWNF